jgi:hypothetical protein
VLAVPDRQYRSIYASGGTSLVAAAETAAQIPQCLPAQNITIRTRFEFSNIPTSFQI